MLAMRMNTSRKSDSFFVNFEEMINVGEARIGFFCNFFPWYPFFNSWLQCGCRVVIFCVFLVIVAVVTHDLPPSVCFLSFSHFLSLSLAHRTLPLLLTNSFIAQILSHSVSPVAIVLSLSPSLFFSFFFLAFVLFLKTDGIDLMTSFTSKLYLVKI